jgi:uncharacterized membrane protein
VYKMTKNSWQSTIHKTKDWAGWTINHGWIQEKSAVVAPLLIPVLLLLNDTNIINSNMTSRIRYIWITIKYRPHMHAELKKKHLHKHWLFTINIVSFIFFYYHYVKSSPVNIVSRKINWQKPRLHKRLYQAGFLSEYRISNYDFVSILLVWVAKCKMPSNWKISVT